MRSKPNPTLASSPVLIAAMISALLLQTWLWATHTHPSNTNDGQVTVVGSALPAMELATVANEVADRKSLENHSSKDCDQCLRDGPLAINAGLFVAPSLQFSPLQHAPLLAEKALRPWMSARARGPPTVLLNS